MTTAAHPHNPCSTTVQANTSVSDHLITSRRQAIDVIVQRHRENRDGRWDDIIDCIAKWDGDEAKGRYSAAT